MIAPDKVQRESGEFFDQVRVLVGDRFAEARFDPDRGLRVTIVDLEDRDVGAITELAQRLGVDAWVRIERADPLHLSTWERLRQDLIRLRDTRPAVLRGYPGPDPGYRRPPVKIALAADAEVVAAELHNAYGDFVALRVGALPYPVTAPKPRPIIERDTASPEEMRIVLETPLSVRSGEIVTHALALTNLSERDISVRTNGNLTATIIDEAGATVGGNAGGQRIPLVIFTARRGQTVRIPLLVTTASFVPELGYAIPAGTWRLRALMYLDDGRQLFTPALTVTITG